MVEKRLKRKTALALVAMPPSRFGNPEDASMIVLAWGSTLSLLDETLQRRGNHDIAGLHFSQVFPLSAATFRLLRGKRLVVIENNATGQFADLVEREAGVSVSHRILKATGEPFAVEEVDGALEEISNA
jgi:2-oxoglutarate ferredoxin oxidoreductase subunit alpha